MKFNSTARLQTVHVSVFVLLVFITPGGLFVMQLEFNVEHHYSQTEVVGTISMACVCMCRF